MDDLSFVNAEVPASPKAHGVGFSRNPSERTKAEWEVDVERRKRHLRDLAWEVMLEREVRSGEEEIGGAPSNSTSESVGNGPVTLHAVGPIAMPGSIGGGPLLENLRERAIPEDGEYNGLDLFVPMLER
eukprot:g11506.t1